jgi:hypothetical protein
MILTANGGRARYSNDLQEKINDIFEEMRNVIKNNITSYNCFQKQKGDVADAFKRELVLLLTSYNEQEVFLSLKNRLHLLSFDATLPLIAVVIGGAVHENLVQDEMVFRALTHIISRFLKSTTQTGGNLMKILFDLIRVLEEGGFSNEDIIDFIGEYHSNPENDIKSKLIVYFTYSQQLAFIDSEPAEYPRQMVCDLVEDMHEFLFDLEGTVSDIVSKFSRVLYFLSCALPYQFLGNFLSYALRRLESTFTSLIITSVVDKALNMMLPLQKKMFTAEVSRQLIEGSRQRDAKDTTVGNIVQVIYALRLIKRFTALEKQQILSSMRQLGENNAEKLIVREAFFVLDVADHIESITRQNQPIELGPLDDNASVMQRDKDKKTLDEAMRMLQVYLDMPNSLILFKFGLKLINDTITKFPNVHMIKEIGDYLDKSRDMLARGDIP